MNRNGHRNGNRHPRRVRYALVALGHISQNAVLPGFLNAKKNSEVTALISDDPKKMKELSEIYKVPHCYSYDRYDECLRSGEVDAVYIALPNDMHREFTARAAQAGVHVLCEKPMALDERECLNMIRVCDENNVKLMIAYRLHFERANLEAINVIKSGAIGEPRFFNSLFSMQVKEGIRTRRENGGGTLYDIGIYCINAARYLFRAEPLEVFAFSEYGHDQRFHEVDEMTSATLRFPGQRLATFTSSFGAGDEAMYEVVGTRGKLRMYQAYEYSEGIEMEITDEQGRTKKKSFKKRDQFGPELIYFSDCILKDREPEPSGVEGLCDVHVICSLYESACKGIPISLENFQRRRRPSMRQEIQRPFRKPLEKVHSAPPHH
jgi:predicted dehydrogenase